MRIRTREGDWYVATSQKDWSKAFARMRRQVVARDARMTKWEQGRDRTQPAFWEAYRRERARIPVEYPMPEGHVMFKAGRAA